jgi:uncharacterized membrane protein YbaN (DUF454 family)
MLMGVFWAMDGRKQMTLSRDMTKTSFVVLNFKLSSRESRRWNTLLESSQMYVQTWVSWSQLKASKGNNEMFQDARDIEHILHNYQNALGKVGGTPQERPG